MTGEEKLIPKKRYFCFKKREVYRVLLSITTSFIGALLALAVFAAVHKPPRMPGAFPPPPQFERVDIHIHKGGPDMRPPMRDFRGDKRGELKMHKHHKGAMLPPDAQRGKRHVNPPAPAPQKTDKK